MFCACGGAAEGEVELEKRDMISALAVWDLAVGVGALKSRSKMLLPVGAGGAAAAVA